MKYLLLPIFVLSTLSLRIQSAPTPCPNDIVEETLVIPAITPEPTDAPCDEVKENVPAATSTPEPTDAPCDEVTSSPEPTDAPKDGEWVLECDDEVTVIECGDEQSQVPEECDGTDGWYPISVEGVAGIFCVQQDLCVAENASGNCPLPRSGLPHGSVCGLVRTGVFGCIPALPETYSCGSNDPKATPTPEEKPIDDSECDELPEKEEVTVSPSPAPKSYIIEKPETTETVISCGDEQSQVPEECDGTDGWYPISVEGVAGIFCVQQDLCVAENASGNCPLPRSGLPHGSVCGLVRTGVFGCIPALPGTYSCDSDPEATPTPQQTQETSIINETPTGYNTIVVEEEEQAEEEPTYSSYTALTTASVAASGSSLPAAAVAGIALAGAVVVIAMLAAGYRRHQQAMYAEEVIDTPIGDQNI